MILLEPTYLSNICDYSFGDQSSVINNIAGGWMKDANNSNKDFFEKYEEIKSRKDFMTLFIDNLRLYKRPIEEMNVKSVDYDYVNNIMNNNDLLNLCSEIKDMQFVIFTGLEDTPIDKFIYDKIPENVLGIYASNAICFGGKVHPIPYGLQRKMHGGDNRLEIIESKLELTQEPTNLLYLNHTISNNSNERGGLNELFEKADWATINANRIDYASYLDNIKKHKFMICPVGNALDCDCHRNWEVLYMRRVPIMKRCEYLEFIFKDFPVLFVNEYSNITEELLVKSDNIFNNALNLNFELLDLEKIYNSIIKQYSKT